MRRLLIVLVLAGCSLGEPAKPEAGDVPSQSAGYLAQRVRRLGSRELLQAIFDVTGVAVPEARVAPLFTRRKYDNGDPDAWVTSDVLAAVEEVAWFVGDEVVRTRQPRVFDGCDDPETCRVHVLGTVVPRIYRRSLSAEEDSAYRLLWDDPSRADLDGRVRVAVAAALQSPAFLYREEVGDHAPGDALALLEPHQIATQLSFLVTGSTPDDELLQVAREGRLDAAEVRLAQVSRLLATPAAAALQRHFLELYLTTAEVNQIRKSPKVYPTFDGGEKLRVDLRTMLDDVVRGGGSTQQLLSQTHQVGQPLESQFSGGPPIKGVLMHPAFLASMGGFENSNPVARGIFVLTNLLCAPPPPPPAGIPRAPADTSKATTTREKFAGHSKGSCQACHKAIDGIGFGFEEFDGAGRFREEENGKRVDASGLVPVDGEEVPYEGVAALTTRLASSQQVADCFAKHVVRFALGAGERTEDAPLYASLARESAADTTYAARIRRIVASDAFIRRRTR